MVPEEQKNQEDEQMDEIDRFLSTLPSLHISDDMVEDPDFPVKEFKPRKKTTLTSVMVLLAWIIFLFSLLTFGRAAPSSGMTFFNALLGKQHYSSWDSFGLFAAMCYLFGNCVVCAGGLAICLAKKMKMTGSAPLNFLVAGGLSAIAAVVLITLQ